MSSINFSKFETTKFIPYMFSNTREYDGCGASALALLTGRSPNEIGTRDHWSTKFMLSFLRNNGFKTAKLTVKNVVSTTGVRYPIRRCHVILLLLKVTNREASWMVTHGELLYHNFDITPFSAYELLNHPTLEAYLLQHPSWGCLQ